MPTKIMFLVTYFVKCKMGQHLIFIVSYVKLDQGFLDRQYMISGDSYWKLTNDAIAPGYPKSVLQDWQGLPSKIFYFNRRKKSKYICILELK